MTPNVWEISSTAIGPQVVDLPSDGGLYKHDLFFRFPQSILLLWAFGSEPFCTVFQEEMSDLVRQR
jgi:hypothetical protein